MYAVNQYDAIAESYDSLFKDEVSIEENNKIAWMNISVSIRAIRCLKFLGRSIPGIIIYASRLRCST